MSRGQEDGKEGGDKRVTRVKPAGTLLVYFLVLAGFWYAGVSQQNNVAYLLCFFLVSIGVVSLLLGYRNIRSVTVRTCGACEGYADEPVNIRLPVGNASRRPLFGIHLRPVAPVAPDAFVDLELDELPPGEQAVHCTSASLPRGRHWIDELVVSSIYPLGLMRWERRFTWEEEVLVYPAREGEEPMPLVPARSGEGHGTVQATGDDFGGWRTYREGDSGRHVDWKAVARGQPWLVKEFEGESDNDVILDWELIRAPAPEEKLQQLAAWVDECQRRGFAYALKAPGIELKHGTGEAHLLAALRALAVWPETDEAQT